jgi:hypothetical protein
MVNWTYKDLSLATVHDRDNRLAVLIFKLEGEQVLDVRLDCWVSNLRPMRRLTPNTVLVGFFVTRFLAAPPTRHSVLENEI